jgi:UDP-N-acetylglucosamine acyltransferase
VASVHPTVKLGPGVIVGEQVVIEEGCIIGPYVVLDGDTHIGPENRIDSFSVIGVEPQDHKFKGGGKLKIGKRNRFREHCTVHRGHLTDEGTLIGDDNNFFTGVHIAHDCRVGDQNLIANLTMLAGHCEVGSYTNISGHAGFHQFCKVGDHVMISGMSAVRQDIPPYCMVQGDPARAVGINRIGLERKGWSREQILQLKEAFRLLRNGKKPVASNPFCDELMEFKKKSGRGLIRFGRGK